MLLQTNQIMEVYSGKVGRCCCGCSGKYYFNSEFIKEASKARGYEVEPDEINDKMVRKVIKLINQADESSLDKNETYVSIEIGERLYIAYYVEK